MHVLLTGATGGIGQRLVLDRLARGDRLTLVARDAAAATRLFAVEANRNIQVVAGDCMSPGAWQDAVDGVDAVIHLVGAGIGDRRWSAAYKKLLVDSRLDSTHQVVMAIEAATRRPTTLLCASATGIYGDCGDRELPETAPPGEGFLAELCVRWEAEAQQAVGLGVRTVNLRTGVVLDERAGAVRQIVPIVRRFIGGPLGSGRQYFPWVHWRDVVGLVDLALRDGRVRGPLNITAPNPVTNREFMQAMGAALNRPAFMPVPGFALRLVKGELATALLSSQRAIPAAALAMGHRFAFTEIGSALRATIGAEANGSNRSNMTFTGGAPGASPPGASPMEAESGLRRGNGAARAEGSVEPTAVQPPGGDPRRPRAAPSRVRLMAIDVDGTLLRSNGRLADPVIAALRRAERNGVAVVLATARSPRMMREIVDLLRLEGPTINCNGAVIWNPIDRRAQYHEALTVETASAVVAAARAIEPELVVEVDVLDRCHTDRVDNRLQLQVSKFVQPDTIGPLAQVLNAPVTRLNLVATPERLAPVIELLRRDFWSTRRVALFLSHPNLVQVTAPLVDKGIALQRIARRLSCPREEVMAVGDAANDLGMLEWAGFGVAVGNAGASVKALADAVAPSNDDNGVAWAIERWVAAKLA